MKKYIWICLILALIFTLSAVGCSSDTDSDDGTQTESTDNNLHQGSSPDTDLPEKFLDFYHDAEHVYALFTGYRSDIYTNATTSKDGAEYREVDINGYTTLAELREFCEQYFSAELTDELMSKTVEDQHPLFAEIEGRLFRFDGYTALFGYDVGESYNITLENAENGNYTVKVDATMTENNRELSATAYCTYTLTEDGEIRFSSFELMAEKLFEALGQMPVEPKPWQTFEYDGVKYDLSEIYSGVNGVEEWGRIGEYVIAAGHINPNISLFAVINPEAQKIEHHFTGSVPTYYGDDISTIVYAYWNTIRSFDGTFFVDLVLDAGEYIRELKYSDDKTQIYVTIDKDSSSRTVTLERFSPETDAGTTEDKTQYKVDIPLEDERDFITVAGVYGKGTEARFPDGNVLHAGEDGTLYYVMGVGNSWWSMGNFKSLRTYRVTSQDGNIESVEEVETFTKDKVLKNGKPYTGELDGMFTCLAYRFIQGNFNYDFWSHSIYIQNDGTIYANAGLVGTGGPINYEGTYQYDVETGDFTAKLIGRYADNGEIKIYPESEVKGKLYEYGGFVHFICESSGVDTLTVKDPIPLTFVPNTDGYADSPTLVLDDTFNGVWDSSYTDDNGEHSYRLSIVTRTAQIQFDDGIGSEKDASRYVGTYTINPLSYEQTATLRSLSQSAKEAEFTLKFTLGYSMGIEGTTLLMDIRACDAPSYQHLVGKTLVFEGETVIPYYPSSEEAEDHQIHDLDQFTWTAIKFDGDSTVAILPEDIAREYNEISYNNMSFVIVDTKGSKTYAAIKTNDMYTAFREISPAYRDTVKWQPFENVLGEDGLILSYETGANSSDICYYTFENSNPNLILVCNKSATAVGDMVLEAYGSMGAIITLYKRENGAILKCDINSVVQSIFPEAHQFWIYTESNLQYKSHDLLLKIDLSETSDVYYGWIENDSLHLINEKDVIPSKLAS